LSLGSKVQERKGNLRTFDRRNTNFPPGRIGVATGKLGPSPALAVPLIQWADAAAPNTVRSFFSPGVNYLQLVALAPWTAYGSFTPANTLKAAALDGDELPRLACATGAVPSFGLVVGDITGFEVRRGDCGQSTVARWIAVRPRHAVALEETSLRMNGPSDPLVAGSRTVNGNQFELSVWKYYE